MTSPKTSHFPPNQPSKLTPCDSAELGWQLQETQLAIARRAYELFAARGCEHGHDWEDWFQAESELLCPVSVATAESTGRLSVRANVYGFTEAELKAGVERQRLIILGKKQPGKTESGKSKIQPADCKPELILRVIDLPIAIEPDGAVIELKDGVLSFELHKAVPRVVEVAQAA